MSWIWLSNAPSTDAYLVFRRRIALPALRAPELRVAAPTQFVLTVNGVVLQGGQFSDFADKPTYTPFDLCGRLRDGENTIELLVHQNGEDFMTVPATPDGLWVELRDGDTLLDESSPDWEAAPAPGYRSGLAVKVTPQLGFTFEYDARDGAPDWGHAVLVERQGAAPVPRPVAPLAESPAAPVRIVQAGRLRRTPGATTCAEAVATDFLQPLLLDRRWLTPGQEHLQRTDYNCPFEIWLDQEHADALPVTCPPLADGDDGWYLILDTGRETTGHLDFTIRADAGTVLDFAHGEHLDDGRVRAFVGLRNFADRYICRDGVNRFTHRLRRLGARYLELHITGAASPPAIGFVGILPTLRDLPAPAPFRCADQRLHDLDAAAVATLVACQHEHYEDCPWREQCLYAYDSRNQALYGYYLWGNYDFAAACFRLLGQSYDPQTRYLRLTAPGNCSRTIPIFSLNWISELYDLHLHSGQFDQENLPAIQLLLDQALQNAEDTPDGRLYFPHQTPATWNFCEWVPGLHHRDARIQAPFNLYLVEALRCAASLGAGAHYATAADALGAACERHFWDEARGAYRTADDDDMRLHEHVQALMLYNRLVPKERLARVLAAMDAPATIRSSYSTLPFWVRAMTDLGHADRILPRLEAAFLPSLYRGATTLWETADGGNDFALAGSLCHGWSAIPAYFFRSGILGITPAAPGFTRFRVRPCPSGLPAAAGSVPTPYGPISIAWTADADGNAVITRLDAPAQCQPS